MNRFGFDEADHATVPDDEWENAPDVENDDEDWQESASHWDDYFVDSDSEDDFDGQPDERQEWHDFDPDC